MPYVSPGVDAVAAVLRARAIGDNGLQLDTFTEDTRPTAVAVESLIATAEGFVLPALGDLSDEVLVCPDSANVLTGVHSMVVLAAAMLVEASYWPEQQREVNVAEFLRDLLTGDLFERVADAVAKCRGEATVDDSGGETTAADAAWAFPENAGGMIGWSSHW